MDDRAIGRAQARLMRAALTQAGLSVHALWQAYVLLGGEVGRLEVEAYLHHALYLAPRHRDPLVRAANQLVPAGAIPCSRDLRPEEYPPEF